MHFSVYFKTNQLKQSSITNTQSFLMFAKKYQSVNRMNTIVITIKLRHAKGLVRSFKIVIYFRIVQLQPNRRVSLVCSDWSRYFDWIQCRMPWPRAIPDSIYKCVGHVCFVYIHVLSCKWKFETKKKKKLLWLSCANLISVILFECYNWNWWAVFAK